MSFISAVISMYCLLAANQNRRWREAKQDQRVSRATELDFSLNACRRDLSLIIHCVLHSSTFILPCQSKSTMSESIHTIEKKGYMNGPVSRPSTFTPIHPFNMEEPKTW